MNQNQILRWFTLTFHSIASARGLVNTTSNWSNSDVEFVSLGGPGIDFGVISRFFQNHIHSFFYKDQKNIFQAGMSLDFSDFQAETALKCPYFFKS